MLTAGPEARLGAGGEAAVGLAAALFACSRASRGGRAPNRALEAVGLARLVLEHENACPHESPNYAAQAVTPLTL